MLNINKEEMAQGYIEVGAINLRIANDFLISEWNDLKKFDKWSKNIEKRRYSNIISN